jgi:CRISPR-associated protein Csd1
LILQALYQLYGRLLDEPDSGISPPGYSKAGVSYALNLSETGELLDMLIKSVKYQQVIRCSSSS